jgi:hypothetical protein
MHNKTELEKICRQVIEAGEKATERPWNRSWLMEVYPSAANKREQNDNAEYITISANHAVKMAQTLLEMREALDVISRRDYRLHWSDMHAGIGPSQEAYKALRRAEEIMKDSK